MTTLCFKKFWKYDIILTGNDYKLNSLALLGSAH
jgi:hypothetical protein